jgi:hypothetical protein
MQGAGPEPRQNKAGQDKTRKEKTRKEKKRKEKARQDKTRQDKARQHNTMQHIQHSTKHQRALYISYHIRALLDMIHEGNIGMFQNGSMPCDAKSYTR